MADPDFDWTLVRSFLAVLDAGSLMGAARQRGASQPTLSRHVAELEQQLGVALFERTGRGVQPTAAALALADAARTMAEGAQRLGFALARQRSGMRGTVRLSASQVVANHLLPPVLATLAEAEPGLQIELVSSNAVSNLLRREADVAVRMLRPTQASLVARKLGDVPVVACAHRDYLARHGRPAMPTELRGHRLLGYDRDDTILRGCANLGMPLEPADFALRTDDQLAYAELIAAGAGIGFIARYTLARLPGVEPILPDLPIPPLPCWLVVHREIHGSAVVRRVVDHLAQELPPLLAASVPVA